jgi:hypothetical protein
MTEELRQTLIIAEHGDVGNDKRVASGLQCVRENCAAPLALEILAPVSPALPRWANEFRRSAAGFSVRFDHCGLRNRVLTRTLQPSGLGPAHK